MRAGAELRGKPLKADPFGLFREHAERCTRCAAVDLQRPATLVATCLEGAQLWKDAAAFALRTPR